MEVRIFEVDKNLINNFDDPNYEEKLIATMTTNCIPQTGATMCDANAANVYHIADVCYNYDETDAIYGVDVTVFKKY
jgi:hypothetical protein